jgi:hypothetical protein
MRPTPADYIEALLACGANEDRLSVLAEMAAEEAEVEAEEAEPDDDPGPVRDESRRRVEAMLRRRCERGGQP